MFERSTSEQSSGVFDVQAPFLRDLYQRAETLTGQQVGNVGAASQGIVDRFLPGLERGHAVLGDLAAGEGAGQQYLAGTLGTANPYLDAVIDALGEDMQRVLGREVGAGIASDAAGVGGAFGGSRHGIAEGMAHEQAIRSFTDAASQLRFGDYAEQARNADALTRSQTDAATRLGVTGPAGYNLGFAPEQAVWQPIAQYAQAIGRPTVLTQGESDSFGLSL